MILLQYNSKHKINKKSRFYERNRASLFRFFKMKSVLYLTFFCTFAAVLRISQLIVLEIHLLIYSLIREVCSALWQT